MNNNQSTGDNPENKTTEKANEIKCHWEGTFYKLNLNYKSIRTRWTRKPARLQ